MTRSYKVFLLKGFAASRLLPTIWNHSNMSRQTKARRANDHGGSEFTLWTGRRAQVLCPGRRHLSGLSAEGSRGSEIAERSLLYADVTDNSIKTLAAKPWFQKRKLDSTREMISGRWAPLWRPCRSPRTGPVHLASFGEPPVDAPSKEQIIGVYG